jgi:hypothetical protein
MLLHLLGAQQFRPQWRSIACVLLLCLGIAAQARPQAVPGVAYAFSAQLHFRFPVPRNDCDAVTLIVAMVSRR